MRFEMLSGQHTFFGSNHGETVNDVLHRPLPELDAERLGSALIALLQRMLEREQPVASMRQVGAELEQITRELRAAGYERLGTTWGTCSRWMGWPAAPVPLAARSGRPGRAVELLALVDHHPATEPATRNRRVRPPRAEPGARFPPAELEAGRGNWPRFAWTTKPWPELTALLAHGAASSQRRSLTAPLAHSAR